jgi:flagellar biosynthesis/type III secretory pathway protein FliH
VYLQAVNMIFNQERRDESDDEKHFQDQVEEAPVGLLRAIPQRGQTPGMRAQAKASLTLLGEARAQAEQIVSEAESRAQGILAQAIEQGLNKGLRLAAEELRAAEQAKCAVLVRSRELIFNLALALADEAIGESLKEHRETIAGRLDRALTRLPEVSICKIACAPEEAEFLDRHVEAMKQAGTLAIQVELTLDARLTAGELKLEHEVGEIAISPREHLSSLADHLQHWLSAILTAEDLGATP